MSALAPTADNLMSAMEQEGFVTLPNEEREEPSVAIFSGGRYHRPPRLDRRGAKASVRLGGCQVLLDVDGVVDSCVGREKSLG